MKTKEILIIFGLTVLVTGGSWFIKFPMELGWPLGTLVWRGWPLPFQVGTQKSCQPLYILIDLLFWFLVIFVIWQARKIFRKK